MPENVVQMHRENKAAGNFVSLALSTGDKATHSCLQHFRHTCCAFAAGPFLNFASAAELLRDIIQDVTLHSLAPHSYTGLSTRTKTGVRTIY